MIRTRAPLGRPPEHQHQIALPLSTTEAPLQPGTLWAKIYSLSFVLEKPSRLVNHIRTHATITNKEVCRILGPLDLQQAVVIRPPEDLLPVGFESKSVELV